MIILRSFEELKSQRAKITGSLGLVPTMGALHSGHISLVKAIRPKVDAVMATIFVNPTQFGANEDFSKYPRQENDDLAKLEGLADFVYLPQIKDIYPEGFTASVKITGEVTEELEGKFRPTHFEGVTTVVNILFNQTRATHAIFGEKDFQQLTVIRKMVADLSMPIEVLAGETLREADGLAMSSRNVYLSAEERAVAPLIHKTLCDVRDGKINLQSAIENLKSNGFEVQYLEQRWNRLLVAAYLGKTRLIDNITS